MSFRARTLLSMLTMHGLMALPPDEPWKKLPERDSQPNAVQLKAQEKRARKAAKREASK